MSRTRTALILTTLVASLAGFTAAAGAKGISQVAVCGAEGCKDVTGDMSNWDVGFPMGKIVDPPRTEAAFVRVVTVVSMHPEESGTATEQDHRSSYLYVPSLQLIWAQRRIHTATGAQTRAVWQRPNALVVQELGNLLYGVKRFQPRRLDQIKHSPAVTLPEKLGSHPTAATPQPVTPSIPPQPAPGSGSSSDFPWWTIGAALVLAMATAATMRLRRGASEPRAT